MTESQRIKVGVGHGDTAKEAVAQVRADGITTPSFSIVFADARKEPGNVAAEIHGELGGSTWGMTSAGEISNKRPGINSGSVVVMSFQASAQTISFGLGRSPVAKEAAEKAGEEATKRAFGALKFKPEYLFLGMLRKPALDMVAATPYTLLVAHDGRSFVEEDSIRGIAGVVGRGARVVGGSAADDLKRFTEPRVFVNGEAAKDELVIAAVGTSLKNGTGMANAFAPVLGRGAFITESHGRVVKTLNGRPAADVYAELVGAKSRADLAGFFKENPMGVLDATSGYWQVRSPAGVNQEDGSVSFFCAVPPGIGMTLLRATAASRVDSVKAAVARAWRDAGRPKKVAAVVLFNCILCHLHAEHLGCTAEEVEAVQDIVKELTKSSDRVPTIGFSTFGETGATITGTLGHHNQTLTAWVLGDELVHEQGVG